MRHDELVAPDETLLFLVIVRKWDTVILINLELIIVVQQNCKTLNN